MPDRYSPRPLAVALAAALTASSLPAAEPPPAAPPPEVAEARGIVQSFATRLQGELQTAMEQGGPTKAVAVCQERAPAIAEELAAESGWTVGRTSLKVRNPANAPDEWERGVLADFDRRQAAGEDVKPMAHAERVQTEDGQQFRFMKAVPVAQLCLSCHGSELTPELTATLDESYPEDQARGYALGQVRGAFTLSKPL